jgi:DNA modification methylase
MVEVFRLVRELLADDGTLWLNLGDSYAQAGGPGWQGKNGQRADRRFTAVRDSAAMREIGRRPPDDLKPKDLVGMPWRVAFALQADGWVLRQEIIWAKPNPMPESVCDRCTKSHEQLFLFSKAKWIGATRGRFAHISDEDARWLALCIDTEGCIVVKRAKQNDGGADAFGPQVTFGGTNRALVERFRQIVGHGNICERAGKNAPMLYWQVGNNLARDFLHRVYPHLIVKQRQARIAIYVDDLVYFRGGKLPERKRRSNGENAVLLSLWARNKECNRFGDPNLSDVPEPAYGRWDSQPYYFDADAISEAAQGENEHDLSGGGPRVVPGQKPQANGRRAGNIRPIKGARHDPIGQSTKVGLLAVADRIYERRNRRSVWTVATKPYGEAHFAVMPEALVEPCILAGSRVGDVVFDPFLGSGTVGQVAQRLGRRWLGCELNGAYLDLSAARTAQLGMRLEQTGDA